MEFFDSLEITNWKNLAEEEQQALVESIIMYYVSPLAKVEHLRRKNFHMCGMKGDSYEFTIDGEAFVFVPGKKEAILGWDFGVQGLKAQDLLGNRDVINSQEDQQTTYKTNLTKEELDNLHEHHGSSKNLFSFHTLEDIGEYINCYTTPLRKADIPPMIVAKRALPVGVKHQGTYDCVTGECQGNHEFLSLYREEIRQELSPNLSLEESLYWTYPKKVWQSGKFYLEQHPDNSDIYDIYQDLTLTHSELVKKIGQLNYSLLSEDAFEYVIGGGTRRLFRWGNEITVDPRYPKHSIFYQAHRPNMFGLYVNSDRDTFELTDDPEVVKLGIVHEDEKNIIQQVLPLSSYYQSWFKLKSHLPLNPSVYTYRKAIIIEPVQN